MPDHLRSMDVFARVVATGSFSAAGRALDMSQTMVTKHVASLEKRLGVQLLRRTTQRVTPTEAGLRFAESAERILEEVREAEALAAAETVEPQGTLRISAPLSFGLRELTKVLPAYLARHDKVRLDIDFNDRLVDILSERVDMAIRIGVLKDSSLTARRLAPFRVLPCAAPAYLERHGTPRRIEDLTAHNCLFYTLSNAAAGLWTFGEDGSVSVKVSGNLQASSGDALMHAAIAGIGIVYEPTFITGDALRSGQLVPITLDRPPANAGGIHAVWPATRHPSAKMRAMIDHLAECWGKVPPWDRGIE